jgi:hypothetical protein
VKRSGFQQYSTADGASAKSFASNGTLKRYLMVHLLDAQELGNSTVFQRQRSSLELMGAVKLSHVQCCRPGSARIFSIDVFRVRENGRKRV